MIKFLKDLYYRFTLWSNGASDEVNEAIEKLQAAAAEPEAPLVAGYEVLGLNPRLTEIMNEAYRNYVGTAIRTDVIPSGIEGLVWIYNVSACAHEVQHPALAGSHREVPGRKGKKPYAVFGSIPRVVRWLRYNSDTGENEIVYEKGERVAMDFVNTENLGLDQSIDTEKNRGCISVGTNYGKRGLFWSLNNPPTRSEVQDAKKRMAAHYKEILESLGTTIYGDTMTYNERFAYFIDKKYSEDQARYAVNRKYNITPEHHAAANYFNISTAWHPVKKPE